MPLAAILVTCNGIFWNAFHDQMQQLIKHQMRVMRSSLFT